MTTETSEEQLSRYDRRGVSPEKPEVHAAVKRFDEGLFPGAFCKILPDILGGNPNYVNVSHPDGAGTKAGLAYLYHKVGRGTTLFRRITWDSIIANLNDASCAGATDGFLLTQTINRNKFIISGEVLAELIAGNQDLCELLSKYCVGLHLASGETADVGDLVRTLTVDNNITVRFPKAYVIDASRMVPKNVLVAFGSFGKAAWEDYVNSGIATNGFTQARHELLSTDYRVHVETYAPEVEPALVYRGKYRLDDGLPGDPRFTVGTALLSTTRCYVPLIKELVSRVGTRHLHGLIQCSGGGQKKITKFGRPGNLYVKDSPFPPPAIFQLIAEESGLGPKAMHKVFNMGHLLEAAVTDRSVAEDCIAISTECGIPARILGEIRSNPAGNVRQVLFKLADGTEFTYDEDEK